MLTDAELVDGVVAGYDDAFAQLYERHSSAAWRLGRTVTGNSDDAADAVAEAFARVLVAVRAGHLDNGGSFRSYLLTATRNAALDNIRKTGRTRPTEQDTLSEVESNAPTPSDRLTGDEEAALIAEAFRNLPERWRSVLWLTEVEGVATKDAASRLGLSPNGAAQLAVRARTGLRERFLQAHLRKSVDPLCRATVDRLGAYVGGGLAPRDLAKVDQHLAGCTPCQARRRELDDVRTALRRAALPVPLVLGGALGATGSSVVATGGSLAKLFAWTQQAWAQKVAALAAASTLAVGAGGAYMAGSNDDRSDGVVPTVALAVEKPGGSPSTVPAPQGQSPATSAESLERTDPSPPPPAALPSAAPQSSGAEVCPEPATGSGSLLGSATVGGSSGEVAVDAAAERSALIGDVTVDGPPGDEGGSMGFGALVSRAQDRQRAAEADAAVEAEQVPESGGDSSLDLDVALGDVGLDLSLGSDTGGDEVAQAAGDGSAECSPGGVRASFGPNDSLEVDVQPR